MKYILMTTLMLTFFGCQRSSDPELVLREYIESRFDGSLGQSRLLGMTTGDLRDELELMSEDEIKHYLAMDAYQLRRMRIDRKTCSEQECFITYTIRFDQYRLDNLDDKVFEAEVRKIAKINLDSGAWKISDVSDVKTFYRANEAIEP